MRLLTFYLICFCFSLYSQGNEKINLVQKFRTLKEQYNQIGKDIYRVQDFLALRFIDRKDWERAKALGKNIENVYEPAPLTWMQWSHVTFEKVHIQARETEELSYHDLIDWSFESVKNTTTPSRFGIPYKKGLRGATDSVKWAYSYHSSQGLDYKTIKRLEGYQFLTEKEQTYKKLKLKWHTIKCHDRKSPDELGNHFPAYLSESQTNCGTFHYPYGKNVESGYKKLIDIVNDFIRTTPNFEEAFNFAINVQKEFVFLHPLHDGNGRTSRWLMDYIMLKLDYPIIIHNMMNEDMIKEDSLFKKESLKATTEILIVLEKCLASSDKYCQEYQ